MLNVDPPLKSRKTKCNASGLYRMDSAMHQLMSRADFPDPVVPATMA